MEIILFNHAQELPPLVRLCLACTLLEVQRNGDARVLVHPVTATPAVEAKAERHDKALGFDEGDVLELASGNATKQLLRVHERQGYT